MCNFFEDNLILFAKFALAKLRIFAAFAIFTSIFEHNIHLLIHGNG